jgi:hypothetical protein
MNPTTTFRIAITDGFLVFTSWVIFYFLRFNSLPSFSRGPTVVIISWLSIHYILGTYKDLSIKQLNFSRYMINNFLASSLILALTFIYKKTNEGHITSTIGLDFIPKVLVLAMLAGQILLFIQKLEHLWSPQQNWLLITDPIERKIIAAEIEEDGCSIPCNIEWRSSYGLASLPKELALLLRLNGVAIGDEQKISKQDKLTLQHWQSNGIRILSLASWCDKFLERIAPSLVTESWSIRTEVLGILQSGASLRIKRFLDIFMSLAFTLISVPTILALLYLHVFGHKVRITSNECIGLNGNPFQSLKLKARFNEVVVFPSLGNAEVTARVRIIEFSSASLRFVRICLNASARTEYLLKSESNGLSRAVASKRTVPTSGMSPSCSSFFTVLSKNISKSTMPAPKANPKIKPNAKFKDFLGADGV